jgi:hypothetical protein
MYLYLNHNDLFLCQQVKVMKSLFADYKTPTMAECEMLGREIGLAKRVIQVWFQNARAKDKKYKLTQQKTSGEELDPPKLSEECKFCGLKYSPKYSVQDHIFTKKHIDMIKASLESGKSVATRERVTPKMRMLPTTAFSKTDPSTTTTVSNSDGSVSTSIESYDAGNIPSTFLNGQQATLLQQLQLLQQIAEKSVSGSEKQPLLLPSPSSSSRKASFNTVSMRRAPTTATAVLADGSCTTTASNMPISSGLSSEEMDLLQLYGLDSSTSSSLMRPTPMSPSGKQTFTHHHHQLRGPSKCYHSRYPRKVDE